MTDNTTLDAAIEAADEAVCAEMADGTVSNTDQERTYARALIAKLIEGMYARALIVKLIEGMEMVGSERNLYFAGFNAALTEIRRRAGLEVES